MKLVLACLALAACATGKDPVIVRKPVDMPSAATVKPLATASNTFAFELWRRLGGAGNAAMSPASISTALAMTWAGARGATSDEMRAVLHLTGDPAEVAATWGQLAGALQDPRRQLKLRIANRLFGQSAYKLARQFVYCTATRVGAPRGTGD